MGAVEWLSQCSPAAHKRVNDSQGEHRKAGEAVLELHSASDSIHCTGEDGQQTHVSAADARELASVDGVTLA